MKKAVIGAVKIECMTKKSRSGETCSPMLMEKPMFGAYAHLIANAWTSAVKTVTQKQSRESYLEQIRIARSRRPRMTPEEFYAQMERSMGMKTSWISSESSLKASR